MSERLDRDLMKTLHVPVVDEPGDHDALCIECVEPWPCDAAALLAALDVADRALDAAGFTFARLGDGAAADRCVEALAILRGQADLPHSPEEPK